MLFPDFHMAFEQCLCDLLDEADNLVDVMLTEDEDYKEFLDMHFDDGLSD